MMSTETSLKTVVSEPRSLGVKVLAADEFSVQSLMKLGLTEYEARIYVVLTKMGPRNASEISFLGKVPRPKHTAPYEDSKAKDCYGSFPANRKDTWQSHPTTYSFH